mmetsp:Transcript_23430/g.32848  ORF Transcript_23430/g.32848 Transcript_23430/m.32848 type:complete len:440 (+) Transcript_23430:94-1413(+)
MVFQGNNNDLKNHPGSGTSGDNLSFVTLIDFRHQQNTNTSNNHSSIQISNLIHPSSSSSSNKNSEMQQYLRFGSSDIYETQCVSSKGNEYGSFLVGSRIVSNGSMHVSTRIDPLYFVLHAISTQQNKFQNSNGNKNSNSTTRTYKWQPLDQLVRDLPKDIQEIVSADPNKNQMKNLFDTTDKFGDDMILYKFNEAKTLRWLQKKQSKTLQVMTNQLIQLKRQNVKSEISNHAITGGTGAFHSTFHFADDDDDDDNKNESKNTSSSGNNHNKKEKVSSSTTNLTKQEEKQVLEASLQVICEYLTPHWTKTLCNSFELNTNSVLQDNATATTTPASKGSSSTTNIVSPGDGAETHNKLSSSSSAWQGLPGEEEIDQVMQLTTGVGASMNHDASQNKMTSTTSKVSKAQSAGLKRLAKVNKKGMKSLTSFFCAGPAKKKVKK